MFRSPKTRSFRIGYFKIPLVGIVVALIVSWSLHLSAADKRLVERGRYIVQTSGCNDCHTPMYMMKDGKVPEQEWLTGDALGWHGPWGTTYPANLRAKLSTMSERDWVKYAKNLKTRPPMPFFGLNAMSEEDLKAVYHYTKHLGPSDNKIPDGIPPGVVPQTPYVNMNVILPAQK